MLGNLTKCSGNNNGLTKNVLKSLDKVNAQVRALSLTTDKQQKNSVQRKADHFSQLADNLCTIFLSLAHLVSSHELSVAQQSDLSQIIQFVPAFIESVSIFLSDENLLILRHLDTGSIEKLLISRTKLLQSVLHLVCCFYRSPMVSNERRFSIIYENLNNKEFIVCLDDQLGLERELSTFLSKQICTEREMQLAIKALEDAYAHKGRGIKETLARQGLLQFIGYPKEKHIADQIQELGEIMSDLSKEQLHLCLRHLGYDFEKALGALCEREQLPLNLKILLRTRDDLEYNPQSKRKMQLISDEKAAEISEEGFYDENAMDGILKSIESLVEQLAVDEATVELGGKVMVRKGEQESEQKLSAEERTALIAASLRCANEQEEQDEEGMDQAIDDDEEHAEEAAKRVELKLAAEVGQSGRFNRLSALMEENMYDDEYDDSYEHAQLYTEVDIGAASMDEKEMPSADRWGANPFQSSGPSTSTNVGGQPREAMRKDGNTNKTRMMPPKRGGIVVKNTMELKEGLTTKGRKDVNTSSEQPKKKEPTQAEKRLKEQNKGKERQIGADRKKRSGL